jgi:hypothetical protein
MLSDPTVGGVVLTKITPEDEYYVKPRGGPLCAVFLSIVSALRLFLVVMHCLFQSPRSFGNRAACRPATGIALSQHGYHTETMDLESVLPLLGNIMVARSSFPRLRQFFLYLYYFQT